MGVGRVPCNNTLWIEQNWLCSCFEAELLALY